MNKKLFSIMLVAVIACACSAQTDGSGGASGGTTVSSTAVGTGSDYVDPDDNGGSACDLYEQEVTIQTESGETVLVELPIECDEFWFDTGRPADDDDYMGADFIRADVPEPER